MKAVSPDWWGNAGFGDTGLTEDRYVSAVEIKEVNDHAGQGRSASTTVGGLFIFHHAIMTVEAAGGAGAVGLGGGWPVHEVGRNADVFSPEAGKLLRAGSRVGFPNVHMHANGKDTTGHLEVALKFHPKGYQPKMNERLMPIGTGDIDIRAMESGRKIEVVQTLTQPTKITVFEPHMHAAAVRMCLDAIWGSRIETLSCSGYDHSWVRVVSVRRRLGAAAAARHDPARHRLLRQHAGEPERGRSAQLVGARPPLDRQHEHPDHAGGHADRRAVPGGSDGAPRDAEAEAGRGRAGLPAVRVRKDSGRAATRRRPRGSSSNERGAADCALRAAVALRVVVAVAIGCSCRSAPGREGRRQHHAGLRRLGAEPGRFVRADVRLSESRVGRRGVTSRSARTTAWSPAGPISASRRTSSRAAIASCSRSGCRRTSARRRSSGP